MLKLLLLVAPPGTGGSLAKLPARLHPHWSEEEQRHSVTQQHGEELLLPPGWYREGDRGAGGPGSPTPSLLSSTQQGQPEWMAWVSPEQLGLCHHPAFRAPTFPGPTTLLYQQPGEQGEEGQHTSSP